MDWALVVTQPNADRAVSARFNRMELTHHSFKTRRKVVHRGHVIEKTFPIYPRYVFVLPLNRWDDIRNVMGVSGFVCIGNMPAIISNSVVNGLVSKSDRFGVLPENLVPVNDRFRQGEKIRVCNDINPASGCLGIYQYSLGDGTSVVDMDWMGRFVPVSVDDRDLELASVLEVRQSKRKRYHKRRA